MVRLYRGGRMSSKLLDLKPKDVIYLRGPVDGDYRFVPGKVKHLTMLAAGSGITPMYQILLHLEATRPIYPTKAHLIYTVTRMEDVWLRTELEEIALRSRGGICVHFWITK
ncbi:NADH-cytochrome b5 reductase, partial [Quaeritorhiza haematococci]